MSIALNFFFTFCVNLIATQGLTLWSDMREIINKSLVFCLVLMTKMYKIY